MEEERQKEVTEGKKCNGIQNLKISGTLLFIREEFEFFEYLNNSLH